MEAQTTGEIPLGWEWQYEPKWDGFRCLVFRNGNDVYLQSKTNPLARYFPEVVQNMLQLNASNFVLDGELIIPQNDKLSFDALLARLHPAASRVQKLSVETPATFVAFDMLQDESKQSLLDEPLFVRRAALELFAANQLPANGILLSPATTDAAVAEGWFQKSGGGLDGVMAKLISAPYTPGERIAMRKFKNLRTAECIVGGFRYGSGTGDASKIVGSLLLGLYDDAGLLHHVGFTSAMSAHERAELTPKLEKIVSTSAFTGASPGKPSRWSSGRSAEWLPLRPELVVEVQYDHFSGNRFRHGTDLLRWRPDKPPAACTFH
ncbi:MAG: ATP-dependent DNA ligase, partial [Gemmatimonadota bacterium]|nr:ATP-dependent DNA ligase [Gemmatimonadota bacterium]